jgi:hypothetical protein
VEELVEHAGAFEGEGDCWGFSHGGCPFCL